MRKARKVLFVSPEFEKTFWSWKHLLRFVRRLAAFIPLAVLVVAALFPKKWEKELIDLNVLSNKKLWSVWRRFFGIFGIKRTSADLIPVKKLKSADIIVVSGMNGQAGSIKEIVARCLKFGKEVWLGGSILETEAMCDDYPGVTRFCVGKGERIVGCMLADYEKGVSRRIYDAADFGFPSISESPIPLYELLDVRHYSAWAVQDSWACPHECTYCRERVIDGFKWQQRPVESVVACLTAMFDMGFRGPVQIFSSNFVGNIPKAKALSCAMIAWQIGHGYPFEFTIEASILIARDQELMDLMVKAGIKKVFLGLETYNEACLREARKWQNLEKNLKMSLCEAVRRVRQAGLMPMSGYMVGFDNDDPKTFADDMIDFIEATCVIAMVGTVQAQPGTTLWDQLVSAGRQPWNVRSNTAFLPNFPTAMDSNVIAKGFVKILEAIWSARSYYKRICSFLADYGVDERPLKPISFGDFTAFMRANLWIGLLGGPRVSYYYWRSLLETLFSDKRRAFADVVAFWIYQTHFKRATGEEIKLAKEWLAQTA